MQLTQADIGRGEAVERGTGRLELDAEVTAVVIEPDLRGELRGLRLRRAPGVEEIDRLGRRLDQAQRLGLNAEVQVAPGARGELRDVAAAGGEVGKDRSATRGVAP